MKNPPLATVGEGEVGNLHYSTIVIHFLGVKIPLEIFYVPFWTVYGDATDLDIFGDDVLCTARRREVFNVAASMARPFSWSHTSSCHAPRLTLTAIYPLCGYGLSNWRIGGGILATTLIRLWYFAPRNISVLSVICLFVCFYFA